MIDPWLEFPAAVCALLIWAAIAGLFYWLGWLG
jgi:hypothetical protein